MIDADMVKRAPNYRSRGWNLAQHLFVKEGDISWRLSYEIWIALAASAYQGPAGTNPVDYPGGKFFGYPVKVVGTEEDLMELVIR